MLSLIEKLMDEHGSSTILRDPLTLLKAEYEAPERKCLKLQSENGAQKLEIEHYKSGVDLLQDEINFLKSGAYATYVCEHCGSPDLIKTGSRDDPTFGVLGIKQKIFKCNQCGKESAFTSKNK